MKTETAIEWFERELDKLDVEIPFSIFEKAKEMFKEQIQAAYTQGAFDFQMETFEFTNGDEQEYYNETYGE